MEHLSNDREDHPNQHGNSNKLYNKKEHPLLSLKQSYWKLRQQHDQNFLMEAKPLQKKYQHKKKQKIQSKTVVVTVRDPRRKFIHPNKVVSGREIMAELISCMSSIRIGWQDLKIDIKAFKDKYIKRRDDSQNLLCIIKITSKIIHKVKRRKKRSKTMNEAKPVENINKNLQSYLEISPTKKDCVKPFRLKAMYMSNRILSD